MLTSSRARQHISPLARSLRRSHWPCSSFHTPGCSQPRLPLTGCAQSRLPLLGSTRTFFDSASPILQGQQSPTDQMNLVLLSGFLGAGKTTVLETLLREQHGYKLGVIVNDLASVNVDANVLRDAIKTSGTQAVSLENGCVCCSASEDLRASVNELLKTSGSGDLDAIVIELSGVAEPKRAKQILEAPQVPGHVNLSRPVSARTVTVVDTPAFAVDYFAEQTEHQQHSHTESGECDERFGTLLAEQLEGADLILLNKADVATKQEITQTQAMVAAMNETAEIRVTEHGNIDVRSFLAAELKEGNSPDGEVLADEVKKDTESKSSCCVKKTCSSTNQDSVETCSSNAKTEKTRSTAETRFGITSFVYNTDRMMSRRKLMMMMGKWQQARAASGKKLDLQGLGEDGVTKTVEPSNKKTAVESPLTPILRSKGILLVDVNPNIAFYWSHAGKSMAFSVFGPWPDYVPQAQGGFGSPRTELVFIGVGYQEDAIRNLLDSCLLSEEEMEEHRAAELAAHQAWTRL